MKSRVELISDQTAGFMKPIVSTLHFVYTVAYCIYFVVYCHSMLLKACFSIFGGITLYYNFVFLGLGFDFCGLAVVVRTLWCLTRLEWKLMCNKAKQLSCY